MKQVTVVGGGLAGVEAAHALLQAGFCVTLYEQRPEVMTQVHRGGGLAELVCSNSLRSDDPFHAAGLLKREMSALNSLVIRAARATAVPAGGALAVDREAFSAQIFHTLSQFPHFQLIRAQVQEIPPEPAILAPGPLCGDGLFSQLQMRLGEEHCYFYDAIAPVVERDSLDENVLFFQSRYDKGDGADYLNVPLEAEDYDRLVTHLQRAERVPLQEGDQALFFEGCLPIEVMADRGKDTLRFGPLKPVGLTNPKTGKTPFAVIQLRQDDFSKTLWNLVGFQTRMKWGEQKRVFRQLPGFEKARFARYGMIHRNRYIFSPKHLDAHFHFRNQPLLALAGQMTGVEGYLESAASGLVAGQSLARRLLQQPLPAFPPETALGALGAYVSFQGHRNFAPSNIIYGLFPELAQKKVNKNLRKKRMAQRAMVYLQRFCEGNGLPFVLSSEERQLYGDE